MLPLQLNQISLYKNFLIKRTNIFR